MITAQSNLKEKVSGVKNILRKNRRLKLTKYIVYNVSALKEETGQIPKPVFYAISLRRLRQAVP